MHEPDRLPRLRPLARSLDPLAGESLKGYLLRLSYRLRIAPTQLVRRTGCVDPDARFAHISHSLLLSLDIRTFAKITRLSEDEAAALTLIPWADRYPPIASVQPLAIKRTPNGDAWLMITEAIRYCPHCLAGDGSPIQERFGGPWKTFWHLPIAFACPQHRVFLRIGCPKDHPPRRELSRLIIRGGDDDLHPAQCRTPFRDRYGHGSGSWIPTCGVRLDQPTTADRDPGHDLLETQQQLLDLLLQPRYPAATAAHYFTDLRTVTSLLCASWPHGRDLIRDEFALAVAAHVRDTETGPQRDALPNDLVATGTLLTAATALLNHPDREAAVTSHIRAAWPGPPHTAPWSALLNRPPG